MPFIFADEKPACMEMAGGSGTDGIDKLHRAVCHRHVPVLWHRLGMGKHHRIVADRDNRVRGFSVPSAVQPTVAFRVQFWTAGMDMADADIRKMAWDKKIVTTLTCVISSCKLSPNICL